jgi:hypothetical protein
VGCPVPSGAHGEDAEIAKHHRDVQAACIVGLTAGVGVNVLGVVLGAPPLLMWVLAFLMGADTTLAVLAWTTMPRKR